MDYQEYLQSDRWKEIRQWALIFWDRRCVICNSKENIEVHHRTYERLGHEKLTDCIPLCRNCHELHHNFTGNFMRGVIRELEL